MVMGLDLLDEIDGRREIIRNNPDYYLKRSHLVRNTLKKYCNLHSYWIEHPKLKKILLLDNNLGDTRELRARSAKGISRIKQAWTYLSLQESDDKFGYINPDNIREVGRILEPRINEEGFRTMRASLSMDRYVPPNPVKVPDLVDMRCDNLKESDLHEVEVAAQAHLYIAGIQPFPDGNKRTARLFQDVVLNKNDLPPAFIPFSERSHYLDLLEDALVGYGEMSLVSQRPFFDYIGNKINEALEYIIDDIGIKKGGKNNRYKGAA